LPDRDGVALLRELRLQNGHRTTPAIALTNDEQRDDVKRAILAGFQAHLSHRTGTDGLVARVAKLAAWSFRKTSS
jgi:two-component system CheB/CheR fusion protein